MRRTRRVSLDDLAEIVVARVGDGRFGFRDQGLQAFPAERTLDGRDLILSSSPWPPTWLWPCRATRAPTHRASWLDRPHFLCGRDRRDGRQPPSILSNMASAASVRIGLHLAGEHDQSRQSARRIETRKMLGAENGRFPSDRRCSGRDESVSRDLARRRVLRRLAIVRRRQPSSSARRFRPFPQPGEWRAISVVFDRDQRLQFSNRPWFEILRRDSCGPAFGREREPPGRCVPRLSARATKCHKFGEFQSSRQR